MDMRVGSCVHCEMLIEQVNWELLKGENHATVTFVSPVPGTEWVPNRCLMKEGRKGLCREAPGERKRASIPAQ